METFDILPLRTYCPVKAQNAGLFIARGTAVHPTRIIDSHELIFVKQGQLELWEEARIFTLDAGQTLHLWPGRKHGGSRPMPVGLMFYWIHFEIDGVTDSDDRWYGDEPTTTAKVPQVCRMPQPERLERLFRAFLEDQETGMLGRDSANLLTTLMLIEVAQAVEEKSADPEQVNVAATWAHTFIRINYDRPITAKKVADALGYNPDYLGRIYHKVYGCTITQAINRRRIQVACDYLLDGKLTIEEVAQKCRFADPDYFRRVFRQQMQTPPGCYRKEYSRIHVNTH